MAVTINGTTGIFSPATSNSQSGAVAWFKTSWNGSTLSVSASYNIASVTRTSAGQFTVVMANALVDNNYAVLATCTNSGAYGGYIALGYGAGGTPTATTFYIQTTTPSATTDTQNLNVAVFR